MKVLKTKKASAAICWTGLKNTAPKDFPNIGEMEATTPILKALGESIPEYVAVLKEGEQMNTDFQSEKIPNNKVMEVRAAFSKKAILLEQKSGNDMVEITFENADFAIFFQQFERWGKLWFIKLETYLEFRKDLNETNKQSKGKK